LLDAELLGRLNSLGLDESSYRALLVLPLVVVAWADGDVSAAERDRITAAVEANVTLKLEAQRVFRDWLTHRPSDHYVERGLEVLADLALRIRGMTLVTDNVAKWKELALGVAKADGGVMGLFSVSAAEKKAIDELSARLDGLMGVGDIGAGTLLDVLAPQHRSRKVSEGVIVTQDADGNEIHVPVDAHGLTIGRHGENDLAIRVDPTVSRRHCRIFERDGTFWLEDRDSETGTLVDGERVRERRLFGGEKITVGNYVLEFRAADPGQ
jgi:hypothetical protein